MVPVCGFVLEPTGSSIGSPVGWLPADGLLPNEPPGRVLATVGKAAMPPADSDVVRLSPVAVLEYVSLSIESLSGTLVVDTGVDVAPEGAARIAAESGAEVEIEADVGIGIKDVAEADVVDAMNTSAADTR
jgi:hypothetical protein